MSTKKENPAATPLNRRELLRSATTLSVATLAGCAGKPENSAPAVHTRASLRWRLVSSFPRSLDAIYGAAEVLAKRVRELTDGRFEIRPYPAGEIVPGLQVLDAVQQGTTQLGHTASYYYIGKHPALAFDTAVPFGLTARQQNAWLSHGGGRELLGEVFADFGMRAIPCGNTGCQMGGWFRRPLGSVADLKGLKMRIPGLGARVLNELGVTVQTLAGGEIYPALERGAIDATEWVGPYDDEILGFHRIVKNYHYPGWWEPGPTLSLLIGEKAWASLPVEYQHILEVAAAESNSYMLSLYDARNPVAMVSLRSSGVEFLPFPDDIMQAVARKSEELMHDQAAKEPLYAKVFAAWSQFRQGSFRWFATAENAYSSFAYPRY